MGSYQQSKIRSATGGSAASRGPIILVVIVLAIVIGCLAVGNFSVSDPNAKPTKVVMTGEGFSVDVVGELKPKALLLDDIKTGTEWLGESPPMRKAKGDVAKLTRMYQVKELLGQNTISITDLPPYLPLTGDVLKNACDAMIRQTNATETLRKPVKSGNNEGVKVEGEIAWPPSNSLKARVFYVPDRRRLYQVISTGNSSFVNAPCRIKFLESFEVLPVQSLIPADKTSTTAKKNSSKKHRKH